MARSVSLPLDVADFMRDGMRVGGVPALLPNRTRHAVLGWAPKCYIDEAAVRQRVWFADRSRIAYTPLTVHARSIDSHCYQHICP